MKKLPADLDEQGKDWNKRVTDTYDFLALNT